MEKRKEENQKRIGEQFLIIRELLCMTQGDFADIFGIPKDSVKQLEQKEDLSEISIDILLALYYGTLQIATGEYYDSFTKSYVQEVSNIINKNLYQRIEKGDTLSITLESVKDKTLSQKLKNVYKEERELYLQEEKHNQNRLQEKLEQIYKEQRKIERAKVLHKKIVN